MRLHTLLWATVWSISLESVAGHISDPAIHTDPTSIQAQTWPSNHVTPQPVGGGGESQLPGSWSSILSKRAHVVPSTSDTLYYCKCTCFDNFTIVPLYMPENPSKPCTSCTKQFCLDQKLPICRGAEVPDLNKDTGTGKEGDVEARCFQRDSPRDQVVVTVFVLIVMGLLLTAAIRNRLQATIAERGQPTDLREWGEALLPTTLFPPRSASSASPRDRGGARFSTFLSVDNVPTWIKQATGAGSTVAGGNGYGQR